MTANDLGLNLARTRTCENCEHWHVAAEYGGDAQRDSQLIGVGRAGAEWGECRRHAPAPKSVGTIRAESDIRGKRDDSGMQAEWPVTDMWDWCGDWQPWVTKESR